MPFNAAFVATFSMRAIICDKNCQALRKRIRSCEQELLRLLTTMHASDRLCEVMVARLRQRIYRPTHPKARPEPEPAKAKVVAVARCSARARASASARASARALSLIHI